MRCIFQNILPIIMPDLEEKVVFNTQDAHGKLRVVDEADGVRALYFGEKTKQSQMKKTVPNKLVTPYEQVMAAWQIFCLPQSEAALVLGLGGGSGTKHCLAQLPDAKVSVVELREAVVNVARDYFMLPTNDDRLAVYVDDAAQFMRRQIPHFDHLFDLMLVDMYDLENEYAYIYSRAFLSDCLNALQVGGVIVFNVWGNHEQRFESLIAALGEVFKWKILLLPVAGSGNVVVFAFHPDAPSYSSKVLHEKAKTLAQNSGIPFDAYFEEIIALNQQQLSLSINL